MIMDILNQIKAKIDEMKAKYNQERDEEDFPNHSDGNGMYWSGVFACLKEISFFVDHLEVKDVDLDNVFNDEYSKFSNNVDAMDYGFPIDLADYKDFAKHFFELGLKAQKGGEKDD